MERFKNYVLVVIGFAFAGLIGAAFGTGTAQAVVSTLVTAVNTSANPVPTSSVNLTDPGRIAYQSSQTMNCNGNSTCLFTFPGVPSGHRLVVQHVIGELFTQASTTKLQVGAQNGSIPPLSTFFVSVFPEYSLPVAAFDQSVLFYVEPGDVFNVYCATDAGNFQSFGYLTLTGYELDCNAAPCAAIAQ